MVNKFIVSKQKPIQQYALDLSKCLPPPLENSGLDKSDSSVSHDATEAVSTNSAPKPTIQATSSEGAVALRNPVSTRSVGAAKHIFTFMLSRVHADLTEFETTANKLEVKACADCLEEVQVSKMG